MLVAVHVCRPAGFSFASVDEDEALWIEVELVVEPVSTLPQDVGTVLLDRMAGLFCA